MSRLTRLAVYLCTTVAPFCLAPAVLAADAPLVAVDPAAAEAAGLPAVSGINGKLELDLGGISDPESAVFRGGASLSVPIGDAFGLQGDVGVVSVEDDVTGGGALHAFTRDPSQYLFGVTAGAIFSDGAWLGVVGPEAELYLDRFSLEAWAGYAELEYDDAGLDDDQGLFATADLAFYPTDDWRISLGGTSLFGETSLRLATEYQFAGLPLSGTGEVRWHDDGALSGRIGLKGYFGGEADKSLIERHRQDDPPNRVFDLFGAAGNLLNATPPEEDEEPTPEEQCAIDGGSWVTDTDFNPENGLTAGCIPA